MRPCARTLLVAITFCAVAEAAPEPARRAFDFTDSVGVCTHWSYPDTPYGARAAEVRDLLVASGIRHVRDGLSARLHDLASFGIDATVIVDPKDGSTMADLVRAVRDFNAAASPKAVVAVEGTNEPDLFWPKYHPNGYLGVPYPAGAVQLQKDLYTTVKADPATRDLLVMGIALGTTLTPDHSDNPLGNSGELSAFVDWGNFHPYPSGNSFNYPRPYDTIDKYYWTSTFPSLPVEGWGTDVKPWVVYYQKPYAPKPMGATETGYSTTAGGISERVVGKYLPRLFLEFFRKGIKRTFAYELVDEWAQPSNREANFGMIRNDLSPKPSYVAVKSLLSVLADTGAAFDPGTLDFDLAVRPVTVAASTVRPDGGAGAVVYDRTEYVRHVVLAKTSGAKYVVLWHDIADDDTASGSSVELTPPALPATITLRGGVGICNVIEIDEAGDAKARVVAGPSFELSIPDRPIIVEMLPLSAADAAATDADGAAAGSDAAAATSDAAMATGSDGSMAMSDAAAAGSDAAAATDASAGATDAAAHGTDQIAQATPPSIDPGCGCRVGSRRAGACGAPWMLAAIAIGARAAGRRRRRHIHGRWRSPDDQK
jgi:hypothetical protein